MRIDLRTAALTDSQEQKVSIAARLLGAQRIDAKISHWDGTRCDVVVVNADDSYGQQVAALARKRGTGLVAYSKQAFDGEDPTHCHAKDGTAAALSAVLLSVVAAVRSSGESTSPSLAPALRAPARVNDASALLCLADDEWRGRDIETDISGRRISIRASRGRVVARTLSDMLAARDALGRAAAPHKFSLAVDRQHVAGEVAWSLDAFLVSGALRSKESLPVFDGTAYAIRDWPDLGSVPESATPLRVASWLQQRSGSVRERAQQARLPADEVNACLWAFRASNLLVIGETPPNATQLAARPKYAGTSLLAKLAARFGLT